MEKTLRLLAMSAFLFCGAATAVAATTPESDADTTSLKTEVKGIKRILAALPKFSGYGQVGYQYETNRAGVEGDNASTFMVKRLRLILAGNISKVFEYKMQLEGFASSKGNDSKALISVQDLFLKAKVCPQLHFWVGQFPIPLTIENYDLSPGTLETPDFSTPVNKMVCRNAVTGIVTYGRDIGIQATGGFLQRDGFAIIDYNLCVFNGAQTNGSDDNKSKDLVGRLTVRPIKDLRFSGSVNWGEYPNAKFGNYIPMTRYAVGGWYDSPTLMVRAEYAHAGANKLYGENRARVNEQMYYIVAGYKFKGKYMPLFRYDVFNSKENTCVGGAGKQQDFLIGFAYQPITRLKVQADYIISKYNSNRNSSENFGTKTGNKVQLMVIGYF